MKKRNSKGQQIIIWVILVMMIFSSIAVYVTMILNHQNEAKKTADQQKILGEYQKRQKEYQDKIEKKAKELSAKYYDSFKEFEKYPKAFNAASVTELSTSDIREGSGEEFNNETTEFYAYYIGWKPDGTVFDSSFNTDSLKIPLGIKKTGDSWPLIKGWTDGLVGMKVGGVRELTIPANLAYGETGSPNSEDSSKSIDPNTPLKFIVMLIPKYEEVPVPDLSDLKLEEVFGNQ